MVFQQAKMEHEVNDFQWPLNRWNPDDTNRGQWLQLSNNGLTIATNNDAAGLGFIRAIHPVEFPPIQLEGPKICYYEFKYVKGFLYFGLSDKESDGNNPKNVSFFLSSNGNYVEGGSNGATTYHLPGVHIPDVTATMGCGLWEHLGVRKVFFTRNGKILALPIRLPAVASNVPLFPYMTLTAGCQFEDTNFGQRPFKFTHDQHEKLYQEVSRGLTLIN